MIFQHKNTESTNTISANSGKKNTKLNFDLHWVLTIFLVLYSLFSFIWLATLYSGDNGTKICSSPNFVCEISFPYTKQAIIAVNETQRASQNSKVQKEAKNFLRNAWLEQNTLNDDLVSKEQDLEKALLDYKNYLQNYLRFLNGESQLLNGFDQTEYTNKLNLLEEEIQNLRLKRNEIAEKKIESKKKVDQLYIDLNERQENSFKQNR
jgi:hypothetical protein